MPTLSRPDLTYNFPSVQEADEDGFLAYGGDLSPARLVCAYESGIFPWYEKGQPILWWSPPKRMVLIPEQFKVSKSLQKTIKSSKFEIQIDTRFSQVIEKCSSIKRKDQLSTWITEEMMTAYIQLHEMGLAHSFEAYFDGELVGGLYGVSLGNAFFGESMFSSMTDASKVALNALVQFSRQHDFSMIDCQIYTEHLASLGATEWEREKFLKHLKIAVDQPDLQHKWNWNE